MYVGMLFYDFKINEWFAVNKVIKLMRSKETIAGLSFVKHLLQINLRANYKTENLI